MSEYIRDEYETPKEGKLHLLGGIVFGIVTILKITDIIEFFLNRKAAKETE